jgi:hypothetical protein
VVVRVWGHVGGVQWAVHGHLRGRQVRDMGCVVLGGKAKLVRTVLAACTC